MSYNPKQENYHLFLTVEQLLTVEGRNETRRCHSELLNEELQATG